MNKIPRFWLCAVGLSNTIAADAPRYVPVATYTNTPEMNETVGNRAHAILRGQKIESAAGGSLGITISVPTDRATEALQLLAKAIKAEELKLTLIGPKGGIITPDNVLDPRKQFSSIDSLLRLIDQGGNAGGLTIIYAKRWVYIDSEDESVFLVGSRRFSSRSRISFWPDRHDSGVFEIPPSGYRIHDKPIFDSGWYTMELVVSRHRMPSYWYPHNERDDLIWEFSGLWEGTFRLVE